MRNQKVKKLERKIKGNQKFINCVKTLSYIALCAIVLVSVAASADICSDIKSNAKFFSMVIMSGTFAGLLYTMFHFAVIDKKLDKYRKENESYRHEIDYIKFNESEDYGNLNPDVSADVFNN